jgi:hypothetical protein
MVAWSHALKENITVGRVGERRLFILWWAGSREKEGIRDQESKAHQLPNSSRLSHLLEFSSPSKIALENKHSTHEPVGKFHIQAIIDTGSYFPFSLFFITLSPSFADFFS